MKRSTEELYQIGMLRLAIEKCSSYEIFFQLAVTNVTISPDSTKDELKFIVSLERPGLLIGAKGHLIESVCVFCAKELNIPKVSIHLDEDSLWNTYWYLRDRDF